MHVLHYMYLSYSDSLATIANVSVIAPALSSEYLGDGYIRFDTF